ncbi:hypothetical protein F4808DRAFT_455200 [Astrocystis sublimbata]|nr:hypothetical protein F4808DRAFT_455200 [Astrocystis sublimbata]
MAGLLHVPLEILIQITSHLTTPEYGYLRRSCKRLEALLFGAFAREFFSKRQFALVEFSIQALVDISNSRLASSLTHLVIHIEHPSIMTPGVPTREGHAEAVRNNRTRAACIDHREFVKTGADVEMLTDALKRLPNLETVGIRDFHSANRSRDNTVWHSYGYPTFLKETSQSNFGFTGGRREYLGTYVGHIFMALLRAIGNVEDLAFKIPACYQTKVSLALNKLQDVFLDGLSTNLDDFTVVNNDVGAHTALRSASGYFLSRLLVQLSDLRHLRLNFQGYENSECTPEAFLVWLADTRLAPLDAAATGQDNDELPAHFPPAPNFPNLQHLDLGMATVSENELLALYKRYKTTLRGISLHKITLQCGQETKANLWARLCNKMAAADLRLGTVTLSTLGQRYRTDQAIVSGRVTFKGSRNNSVKTWRGSTFSQSVKDITDDMESNWWHSPLPGGEYELESEDDDDGGGNDSDGDDDSADDDDEEE